MAAPAGTSCKQSFTGWPRPSRWLLPLLLAASGCTPGSATRVEISCTREDSGVRLATSIHRAGLLAGMKAVPLEPSHRNLFDDLLGSSLLSAESSLPVRTITLQFLGRSPTFFYVVVGELGTSELSEVRRSLQQRLLDQAETPSDCRLSRDDA